MQTFEKWVCSSGVRQMAKYSNLRHPCFFLRPFGVLSASGDTDTIYALCSGQMVKSGVAVIRVSGSNAFQAVKEMTNPKLPFPKIREATVRNILDSKTKEIIDKGMILCFKEGASYTAEDIVEFHLHGSPAVINATFRSLSRLPSFRSAGPGEFTRRALMNGKMSFLEVESLGDLLNAETEKQRQQALRGMNGQFLKKCWSWRETLKRSLAHAETILDFSDDVDDESAMLADSTTALPQLSQEMRSVLQSFHSSQLIKDGVQITLCGLPNAGKSSLLNSLLGSPAAIVSANPGTTRDVITAEMDLAGFKVVLKDTAGLRETEDEAEREGVRRARRAAADSAFVVVIADISGDVRKDVEKVLGEVEEGKDVVIALNKCDLLSKEEIYGIQEEVRKLCPNALDVIPISCATHQNISTLTEKLTASVKAVVEESSKDPNVGLITRERQRNCLEQCVTCIDNCMRVAKEDLVDMEAEELRNALRSLGQLTGEVDIEEILDIVFSDFCIGK